jgi:hypothetical protein
MMQQLLVATPFLQAAVLLPVVVVKSMLGPQQQQQQQRALMEQLLLAPHVLAGGASVAGVGLGAAGQTACSQILEILQQQGRMQEVVLLQPLLQEVVVKQLVLRAVAGAGAAGVGAVPGLAVVTWVLLLRQVLVVLGQ